jgi:hypothetical protein
VSLMLLLISLGLLLLLSLVAQRETHGI